jgi:hypothetical protein
LLAQCYIPTPHTIDREPCNLAGTRIPAISKKNTTSKKSPHSFLLQIFPSGITSFVHHCHLYYAFLCIVPICASDHFPLRLRHIPFVISNQHSRTYLHFFTAPPNTYCISCHFITTPFLSHCSRDHSLTYLISAFPASHTFPIPPVPILFPARERVKQVDNEYAFFSIDHEATNEARNRQQSKFSRRRVN